MANNPLVTTPEQRIADARKVETFLQDDVIRAAIETLEQKYIEDMIGAETSEARAKAQGKIHATRALAEELARIVAAGAHEMLIQEWKEKNHEFVTKHGLVS